jgi:hypothetical protein
VNKETRHIQKDFKRTSKGLQKDFKRTSKGLQKDFKRTSKGLQKDFDSPASLGLDLQPYERPYKPDTSASDRDNAEYIAHESFVREARKQGASNVQFFTLGNNEAVGRCFANNSLLSGGIVSFVRSFEEAFGKKIV